MHVRMYVLYMYVCMHICMCMYYVIMCTLSPAYFSTYTLRTATQLLT